MLRNGRSWRPLRRGNRLSGGGGGETGKGGHKMKKKNAAQPIRKRAAILVSCARGRLLAARWTTTSLRPAGAGLGFFIPAARARSTRQRFYRMVSYRPERGAATQLCGRPDTSPSPRYRTLDTACIGFFLKKSSLVSFSFLFQIFLFVVMSVTILSTNPVTTSCGLVRATRARVVVTVPGDG